MAWVEDRWLEFNERAQLIQEYESERSLLTKLVEADKATMHDLDRLEYLLGEIKRLKVVHRGEHDIMYFGMTYFSEDANPGNDDNLIPEGVNVSNAADFHKNLCDILEDVSNGAQARHVAWACPRQSAKTAWLSGIFLVHQIVYRKQNYIVLFSETTDVAGDFIGWGRFQLKLNEKLRRDFGALLAVRASQNELDNKYEFITTSRQKVEAKGLGTQTRGLRFGSDRPGLFILDDLESKESTNTSELIEKSKSWFREEMLPALAKGGLCVYLGTILCYDSLLDHVIRERRDFESRKFSAINRFADRDDLWSEWKELYRADTENAADHARAFYEANKDEMLKGVELLWPQYWSYYDFMCLREDNGAKAFNQEYQNEPTDEERQIFKPEYFMYVPENQILTQELEWYGGIDFAMGKEKGDFSVIATIAKNVNTGTCYVTDIYAERVHPDELMRVAVSKALNYQYDGLGVEAQMAQEWFADKLTEELQTKGYPGHTRVKQIKQRNRKALRIEALMPDIQNGKLRFSEKVKKKLDQFFMYPMGHDDIPDAVQMAYQTAQGGNGTVKTVKRMNRWGNSRPNGRQLIRRGR